MAESSDDEDVPVNALAGSPADAPASTAPPAAEDSDSDEEVLGGVRGRLAQKRAAAATPEEDDDLDDLLEDVEVALGPLQTRCLKKAGQAKAAEPSKAPNLKKASASKPEKPRKASKPRKPAKKPKKAEAPLKPAERPSALSDSEDEPVAALANSVPPAAPAGMLQRTPDRPAD